MDNSLELELNAIRQHFGVARQLAREQPHQVKGLRSEMLEDLRRSLEELRSDPAPSHNGSPHPAPIDSAAMAELVARKSATIEASLDSVITLDRWGRVVDVNSAAATTFGFGRDEVLGRDLGDLITPLHPGEPLRVGLAEYRATGESALIGKRIEALAVRSNGKEFPVEMSVRVIACQDPPLLVVYLHDVSARKQVEHEVARYQERLRALAAELLLVEESERRRLAIDLHDGLSQTLALAKIRLSAVPRSRDAELDRALVEIEQLIDQANQSARSTTFELSPPILHDLGLAPAIQWLVENIRARYGIQVVLEDDGRPKPADEKTRVILFRAIRELLINAAKHAGAHRIYVRLERVEEDVQATVDDDGVGMEPETAAVRGSGLFSIRERLSHVRGSMEIDSEPGRGTSICLRAPLSSTEAATARTKP